MLLFSVCRLLLFVVLCSLCVVSGWFSVACCSFFVSVELVVRCVLGVLCCLLIVVCLYCFLFADCCCLLGVV